LNKSQIENIAPKIGDSFFVYEKESLINAYNNLRSSLGNNGEVAFSIKSNYFSEVINDLKNQNSWFEVSSESEYEYVNSLGVEMNKVVVNAPVSTPQFFIKCLNNSSIFNIQNVRQWRDCKGIAAIAPNKEIQIGLRLNLGYNSRFGLSEESYNQILIELGELKNVAICSLHVHVCEGERSVKSFEEKFNKLIKLSENKSLANLQTLNIGGGFYSPMPDYLKDQFKDYIPDLEEYLSLLKKLSSKSEYKLIIEPGGLLVSNSMKFYTKVLSVDLLKMNSFIQVDGSIYDIQPTKSPKQLPYNVLSNSSAKIEAKVVGFTCMEDDVLIESFSEPCEEGDWIEFTNVGAYAQTLRPAFISSWKPIISIDENDFTLHRPKADNLNLFSQWL